MTKLTAPTPPAMPRQQHGVVLLIGLILMVLVSLLGLTAMRTTSLEERMAGHTSDHNLAFQAAEAALRYAEDYLQGVAVGQFYSSANASGRYIPLAPINANDCNSSTNANTAMCQPWWTVIGWTSTDSAAYAGTAISGVARQPRYIIENMSESAKCSAPGTCSNINLPTNTGGSLKFGAIADAGLYRITARGVGGQADLLGNPATVVVLQTYFHR